LLERIAETVNNPEDRAQWLRNLAETLAVAVQLGTYPNGADRLKSLYESLENNAGSEELAAYVKFRYLTAEYNRKLLPEDADYAKIQAEWLESLKQFVADYPKVAETPEAMLQVGNTMEFSGDESGAKKWYADIVDKFHDTLPAKKAAGATRRLDSVGKVLEFHGAGLNGKAVDLSQYRKKAVLIQFWATWCEPCKADHELLKEAQAKYSKNLAVISVSLDKDKSELEGYLKRQPLPWTQIYEPGGFDSRLANELGVVTLPTMILVDPSGKVVHRAITASEIDREVRSILKQTPVAEETPPSKLGGKRQKADRGDKAPGKRS
jgi:thiol-disulfide isomerase/thioredoxin